MQKERQDWKKEINRLRKIEMETLMNEKDKISREREDMEYKKFDFKTSIN